MAMPEDHFEYLTWERMAPRCALVTIIDVMASTQNIDWNQRGNSATPLVGSENRR